MPTCPNCHSAAHERDKFCGQCGAHLTPVSTPESTLTEHALNVVEVKFRLGAIYYKKKNYKAAAEMFREVLSFHPEHSDAKIMLDKIITGQTASSDEDVS
jgi:tetratricopeptide (TPR) repeat protein